MQKLEEIVKMYLEMETSYALMITGEWGTGKTYYYKNVLEKVIAQTNTYNNQQKKYTPIRISVFGLKSIEEIQNEIFLSVYPLLKNKKVKIGGKIAKSIFKGIMQFNGLGNIDDFLPVFDEKDKVDFINFDNLVLCFDDLERISDGLKIEELIGYINSLVENENIKVLIIANENKITIEKYADFKEKIVGNTIEFNLDIDAAYDGLILSKFESSNNYLSFLGENKKFILQTFITQSSNLRILGFALTHFQYVYSELVIHTVDEPFLEKNKNSIFLKLLKFTLAISIEYKTHKITFNKRQELNSNDYRDLHKFLRDQKSQNEESKSYRNTFLDNYYVDGDYTFFTSIYDFITGGDIFNCNNLLAELKKVYHIQNKTVLPQYQLIENLKSWQLFMLDDQEYKASVYQILDYVDKGQYDLTSYTTAFYFASRFENPFRFNLDKLTKRIIKGMHAGNLNYQYTPVLDYYLAITPDSENVEYLARIRTEALKINAALGERESARNFQALEEIFYSDFNEFNSRFFDKNGDLQSQPILKHFNPTTFYSHFLHGTNARRWEMIIFLKGRYRLTGPDLLPELAFLEKLNFKIESKVKSLKNSQPSTFLFKEFHQKVKTPLDALQLAKEEN